MHSQGLETTALTKYSSLSDLATFSLPSVLLLPRAKNENVQMDYNGMSCYHYSTLVVP